MTQSIQADVLTLVGNSSHAVARNHGVSSDSQENSFMNILAGHISQMNSPGDRGNEVALRDTRETGPREDIPLREPAGTEERVSESAEPVRERSEEPDTAGARIEERQDRGEVSEGGAQKEDAHDSVPLAGSPESDEKSEMYAVNEKEAENIIADSAETIFTGAPGKTLDFIPDSPELIGQVDRLLGVIREIPGDSEALRNIKEDLLQLKEFIRNGEEPQRFEALLRDLKTKIETVMRDAAGEGRDMSRLLEAFRENAPDLKREFAKLSEMVSRYGEHVPRSAGERPVEGEQKPAVVVTGERHGSFTESLRPAGHESAQGNNDSNIGFNQFRQGQQFTRAGAAPDNMARMQNFNDQLQSMLNNSRLVVKDGKNGHFTMQLFPESMGRVNVRLGLEDGVIHGRFLVDSNEARNQMLENLGALREKMAEAGISVGEFQVNVRQQQEQFADKNTEENNDARGAGVLMDAGQQYELGAMIRHDGSFDMTA